MAMAMAMAPMLCYDEKRHNKHWSVASRMVIIVVLFLSERRVRRDTALIIAAANRILTETL
jgi:hypothetical protein